MTKTDNTARNIGVQALIVSLFACAGSSVIRAATTEASSTDAQPAADSSQALVEIVVTAQKRSERLVDVPISITVADAATLQNAGITGFENIDQVAVGTKINRDGIYFLPTIRGITTQVVGAGQENNVAVYIDGFYQPSQVGINTDFNNIKDVQVLKGPQGTLFGRNATGGAILIETLDPSFTPVGKASVSYGRFNEDVEQFYFSDGITDTLAFDVAAYLKNSDGYIRDIAGFDTNPIDDRSFRSKLLFKPNDRLTIMPIVEYSRVQDAAGLADTYVDRQLALLIDPATPIATAPNTTSLNFGPISWTETTAGSLKAEYDFGGPKLTSYTRYSHELGYIDFDLDGSELPIFDEHLSTRLNNIQQEFDLGASNAHWDWVTGAFLSKSAAQYFNEQSLVNPVGPVYSAPIDSKLWTTSLAAFGDTTYHLDNGFSFTGGLRYSWERRTFFFAQPDDDVMVNHAAKSWDAVTPRAVVRYEVTPSSNVYASFSKGFKSGTFNTTVPDPTPVNPENVKAYEIGYKLQQGGVQFASAIYYYDYRDLQVSILTVLDDNQEAAQLSNAARAKIYGFEASVSAPITQELTGSVGLAYNHARYTDYPNASVFPPVSEFGVALNGSTPAVQNWSGLRIIGAPDYTANAELQWAHATGIGQVGVAGNVYYSSPYAPTLDDQLNGTYRYQQGGYALFNLNASLAPTAHWKFTIWSRNLTDRRIKINDSGNPFGDVAVYAEPRMYGGRVDYSFK